MGSVLQDLRLAGRLLVRSPGFSLLIIAALALGIGVTLGVWNVVESVVVAPLPYREPDRLVAIWEANLPEGVEKERVAPLNFADYRALPGAFEDAAAWWQPDVNLADSAGEPVRVAAVEATANLFSVLGVRPRLGAGFETQGALYDGNLAAVISDRFWRERYGSDPKIVGKAVQLNGELYTVAGVMPAGFHFPRDTDVWQRLRWPFTDRTRYAHFMEAIGRLRPGVSLDQARGKLAALSERLGEEHPGSNKDWSARLVPLQVEITGESGPVLKVLLVAVSLLHLLGCVNVAGLLLARGVAREKEMALRAALGASRSRLVRQLLTESLLLGLVGTAAGLGIAWAGVRLLVAVPPYDLPRLAEVGFDARMVGYGLGFGLLTVLLCGTLPALGLAGAGWEGLLPARGGKGIGAGPALRRLRAAMVVGEVALAMMLVVGAGLSLRSVHRMLEDDPGFEPEGVLTAHMVLPLAVYGDWHRVSQLYSGLLERLEEHPAVTAAGATGFLPLEPGWRLGYSLPDRSPEASGEELRAQYVTVSAGYFETLGVPVLAGRTFDRRDLSTSPAVVVVSRELARRSWPQGEAVGKRITSGTRSFGPLGSAFQEGRDYEVIGVVGDVKNVGLGSEAEPALYFVQTQFPYRNMNLAVRGAAPELLAAILRDEVKRLDAGVPVARIRPLGDVLAKATGRHRIVRLLLSIFGGLALLLAAVGVYGLLAYEVSRRRGEIGVRLALGATPASLRRLVVGEGLLLAGLGLAIGGFLALALGRLLASVLEGVVPHDAGAFLGAGAVILTASLAACWLPALRASRVAPAGALQAEERVF